MSQPQPNNMTTPLQPTSALPYGQLESLRSKITQMIDSIQTLQRTVEGPSGSGYPYMPAWPDILSKYTMLLSQSHNLSMSLVNSYAIRANGGGGGGGGGGGSQNPYERLALHPSVVMSDAQLDNEVIPLLRNQQTTEVLKLENETVRHLAEHMLTRGSLGVLGVSSSSSSTTTTGSGVLVRGDGGSGIGMGRKVEYADVLSECEQIRAEHDERIERAVNAVVRLRNEKYEWKVRVAVEQEEPEELEWDPRLGLGGGVGAPGENGSGKGEEEGREEEMNVDVDGDEGEESNDSEEEEELEEVLGNGDGEDSGEGTPVRMVEG